MLRKLNLCWSQSSQIIFLWLHISFQLFSIKLGHFIVAAFFLILQTLKLNSKNFKMKKIRVWLDWFLFVLCNENFRILGFIKLLKFRSLNKRVISAIKLYKIVLFSLLHFFQWLVSVKFRCLKSWWQSFLHDFLLDRVHCKCWGSRTHNSLNLRGHTPEDQEFLILIFNKLSFKKIFLLKTPYVHRGPVPHILVFIRKFQSWFI